jgi:hypothetical protein
MNPRIRHQIRLKLIQIDIKRTIKPQTARNTANNLRNKPIQMLKARSRNIQVATTDIVDSFVVDEERAVAVFDGGMGGENGVVGLYYCG